MILYPFSLSCCQCVVLLYNMVIWWQVILLDMWPRLNYPLFLRYHWLPESEWWRLYGDARNYGKKKTVLIGIGNLNHEQMLHKIQYQSPKEFYPMSVFYYGDDRWALIQFSTSPWSRFRYTLTFSVNLFTSYAYCFMLWPAIHKCKAKSRNTLAINQICYRLLKEWNRATLPPRNSGMVKPRALGFEVAGTSNNRVRNREDRLSNNNLTYEWPNSPYCAM